MWEGESRICGSQLLNCQRRGDKSRAFVIPVDQISPLYLYGPLRVVSVSPPRACGLQPCVRRASLISNIKFLSSPLGCRRAANVIAAHRIDLWRDSSFRNGSVPVPRFSSQVDKVSLVKHGSSWEPSEGNKLNGSLKVEEIQK